MPYSIDNLMTRRTNLILKLVFLVILPTLIIWANTESAGTRSRKVYVAPATVVAPANETLFQDVSRTASGQFWAMDYGGRVVHFSPDTPSDAEASRWSMGWGISISFLDATTGFAFKPQWPASLLWKTSDGAKTWFIVNQNLPVDSIKKLQFLNEETGFLCDARGLWLTSDRGRNWKAIYVTERVSIKIEDVSIVNQNSIMLATTAGLRVTRNGGRSWSDPAVPADLIAASDRFNGWALNDENVLFKSDDGGLNWRQISLVDSSAKIRSLCFISWLEGWATGAHPGRGGTENSGYGMLFHTIDGGKTWETLQAPEDPEFRRVEFSDSINGFLLGQRGLYRTTDGGRIWKKVGTPDY